MPHWVQYGGCYSKQGCHRLVKIKSRWGIKFLGSLGWSALDRVILGSAERRENKRKSKYLGLPNRHVLKKVYESGNYDWSMSTMTTTTIMAMAKIISMTTTTKTTTTTTTSTTIDRINGSVYVRLENSKSLSLCCLTLIAKWTGHKKSQCLDFFGHARIATNPKKVEMAAAKKFSRLDWNPVELYLSILWSNADNPIEIMDCCTHWVKG